MDKNQKNQRGEKERMSESRTFWSGIPWEPDVKRIRKAFPDSELKVGAEIPYSAIAETISSEYGTCRFRSVTMAWRKAVEKEAGLFIGTSEGKAFRVLSESEKLGLSRSKVRASIKSARRAYVVSAAIDDGGLTDEEKSQLSQIRMRSASIIALQQIKPKKNLPDV
jgi:hypothetical protein